MNIIPCDSLVIGSGAAGFSCACRLKEHGVPEVILVTEGINMGTSRNTGSDKQTYYKLGIAGDTPDSVVKMANDLFNGGCVDGDNALCEASLSLRCFMYLAELGVEFPTDRYGQYVGYKTDHDPYCRATSAGPLTSRMMTEVLEKRARKLGVKICHELMALEIIKDGESACGLLCINIKNAEITLFNCSNIILACGGPAGIYADSVYPECHSGASSLAIKAGAELQNVTEWQYGIASVSPRWNVSGTYMQVLPRFVSVDKDGIEHDFIREYFGDEYEALSCVFLKGYQWPFDCRKVLSSSSVIDLLVYRERVINNRRVYLDFTKNPFDLKEIEFQRLSDEAYSYLKNANACFGTPIERLRLMNAPAIELYQSKGVDISREYLEISVCAQHNNGGVAVDAWWQSSVKGLFAIGECAGTHGVARPGGSALNAGQVGALRAAQYVSSNLKAPIDAERFNMLALPLALSYSKEISRVSQLKDNVGSTLERARRRMSDCASVIRVKNNMISALESTKDELDNLDFVGCDGSCNVYKFYKLKDALVTQMLYLSAMIEYCESAKGSRGSCIYYSEKGSLRNGFEEAFRFELCDDEACDCIQMSLCDGRNMKIYYRKVRQIPESRDTFEAVWKNYRTNKNVY